MVREYDKIRLINGEIGRILEILSPSVFLAEIARKNGGIDTTEVRLSEIKSKFIEHEEPIAQAI